MLPLMSEVRRQFLYRITDPGRETLFQGAREGKFPPLAPLTRRAGHRIRRPQLPRRRQTPPAPRPPLRHRSRPPLLNGMVRKKWLIREAVAEERDARRTVRYRRARPRRPHPQTQRQPERHPRRARRSRPTSSPSPNSAELAVPASTLATLVKRNLVRIEDRPEDFHLGGLPPRQASPTSTPSTKPKWPPSPPSPPRSNQAVSPPSCSTASPAPAKPPSTSPPCSALSTRANPPSSSSPKSASPPPWPATCSSRLRHRCRPAPLRPHARRARRAVAPHSTRRSPHRRRHPLRRLCARRKPRPHHRRRGARLQLQAGVNPRYHGRDVAVMRAKLDSATIVLGSATPSLESWHNCAPGQLRAHRDAPARDGSPAAYRRPRRHAHRVPGDRRRAPLLPRHSSTKPRPPSTAASRSSSCSTAADTPSPSSAAPAAKRSSARTAPSP